MHKSDIINPFAKSAPTIFAIGSPFQTLCAVGAIKNLGLKDYEMYVIINRNSRDEQMLRILDFYHIDYTTVNKYSEIYPYMKRLFILQSRNNHYHRAFVGSMCEPHLYFWVLRRMSNHSVVVSLDDGAETISILQNRLNRRRKNIFSFLNDFILNIACKKRDIIVRRHMLTIYSDIKNERYICQPNNLTHLISRSFNGRACGVFFVGTNPSSFRNRHTIGIEQYDSLLEKTFNYLCELYPKEKKYYVAHGMDEEETPIMLCKKYGYDYIRPYGTIELYMCERGLAPVALAGYTSSALFNIKKIFPGSSVLNILLENVGHSNSAFVAISEYYAKNEIVTVNMKI